MNIVELTNVEMQSIYDLIKQRIDNYTIVKNTCGQNLDENICKDSINFWLELKRKFIVISIGDKPYEE